MERSATAMLALALAASAALGVAPAQAQTTLVSNTGESFSVINVGNLENGYVAQQFTTGANASGYELSSVELYVGALNYTGTETMTWRIHEYEFRATRLLGPLVATLSTPSPLTANAVNEFTAPSGTILKPNTRYMLNLHSTGDAADDAQIGAIQDNGESGLSDWRIEDAYSGANRSPIPGQTDHSFRRNPITDSGANRSLIPAEPDHRFRRNPISDSGGKPITFWVGTGMVQEA